MSTVTATLDGQIVITEPGVYDIPAESYHADPIADGSLSSSGARKLLPPSCPALFKWEQDHPRTPTAAMQLGTAAHKLVLGVGIELVRIDAADWKTKAARAARDEALAAGAVPLLPDQHDQVTAMAEALRRDERAAPLLNPAAGRPEQALFWKDKPSGIWRRALLDFLRHPEPSGRLIGVDYKTAAKADEESVKQSIHRYGYHCQGSWYADGVKALGLAEDVPWLLVVQETNPPYLVNVVQLDDPAMRIGAWLNRQAIGVYAECMATDRWPGYGPEIEFTGLPPWAEIRALEEMNSQ